MIIYQDHQIQILWRIQQKNPDQFLHNIFKPFTYLSEDPITAPLYYHIEIPPLKFDYIYSQKCKYDNFSTNLSEISKLYAQ